MNKKLLLLATISIFFGSLNLAWAVKEINLYFPPQWKDKPQAAQQIADGLSQETGIKIIPRIADCYLEILNAITEKKPVLAYVGSMVQTIIWSRKLGTPLLQALDHEQKYGGIMLVAKGVSPSAILQDYPAEIAYTVGATSGEVCAKAATDGKASIAVSDQRAAVDAITKGKAKAAFVKNTWFEQNRSNYPDVDAFSIPGVSEYENADNVLLVSKSVTPELKSLIMSAAIKTPHMFNAEFVAPFDSSTLNFTLDLMKKAGIDPLTYTWQQARSGQCNNKSDVSPVIKPEPATQKEQSLSVGEILLEQKCGNCHLGEKIKQYRRKTSEQWERSIVSMGVKMTEAEQNKLITYLHSLKQESPPGAGDK